MSTEVVIVITQENVSRGLANVLPVVTKANANNYGRKVFITSEVLFQLQALQVVFEEKAAE